MYSLCIYQLSSDSVVTSESVASHDKVSNEL
jgi:hypothetical protein